MHKYHVPIVPEEFSHVLFMWGPCCECCEGRLLTGCDARTESGLRTSQWLRRQGQHRQSYTEHSAPVHLVMSHNHNTVSVSAFIIREIPRRKEEHQLFGRGRSQNILSWCCVLTSWLTLHWADDHQSTSQDIFPSVTLSPLPPHSTFTLIILTLTHYAASPYLQQPTNIG